MITDPLSAIAIISVTAITCQWVGSRLGVPSVLFLLVAGVSLSPVMDPDELFGELLFTGIGLGVAVLLFEGGTSLVWRDLSIGREPVLRLVTVGAAAAWMVGSIAAATTLDIGWGLAILTGAVLIVSGPTVVIPLLRVVRPREPVGSTLRWEGIVIDPIGAGVAIVVLDALIEDRSPWRVGLRALSTFGSGAAIGILTSGILISMLARRLVPDHLQVPLVLAGVIGSYGAANAIRPEAGLIAVTVLGITLANQRKAAAHHIAEFNENLGTAILGVLFVVLGARVEFEEIREHLVASLLIVAALVLVARPASVLAATIGTEMSWRERSFLMALAPRGVVAAAVASLFALELEHVGLDPGPLVPVVFTVVVVTVAIAGSTAAFVARRLRVAQPAPNGIALIGGGEFAVDLARALASCAVPTIHIGLDDADAEKALSAGLLVYSDRLDTEMFDETITALGIHAAIALSTTDHLNGYVVERLSTIIDSAEIHGLFDPVNAEAPGTAPVVAHHHVLPEYVTTERLQQLHQRGAHIRVRRGAAHPQSGWLTICRVDNSRNVYFESDPTAASDTDQLIQFGPALPFTEST